MNSLCVVCRSDNSLSVILLLGVALSTTCTVDDDNINRVGDVGGGTGWNAVACSLHPAIVAKKSKRPVVMKASTLSGSTLLLRESSHSAPD